MTYGYRHGEVDLVFTDIPDVTYRLLVFTPKQRKRLVARKSLGCNIIGAAEPVPDIKHAPSQVEGAVKRLACAMPPVNIARKRRLKRFVIRFLKKEFKDQQFSHEEDFNFEDWITECANYTVKRKDMLRELNKTPFDKKKDRNVKGFTKNEPYPNYKHFRGIHSRSDRYKCAVGPFFKKFDQKIFNSKFFIKKVPVCDRPTWLMDKFSHKPNVFCTDFTSFEATFVRDLMVIEHQVYSWFLEFNPNKNYIMDLIKILREKNMIRFDDFLYEIQARRMSGEMNTSGGNGIMNLLLTMFLMEEAGNVHVEGAFEGDDGVVWYDRRAPAATDYSDLGGKIKIEIPPTFSEASFCGMIFDVEALDNVTDPVSVLMSFGYTTDQYLNARPKKLRALLRSKALSLLYQYPGCPILKNLALYGLRMTSDIDDEYLKIVEDRQINSLWDKNLIAETRAQLREQMYTKKIDYRTRLLVERKFGISIELQLNWEQTIDNMSSIMPFSLLNFTDLCHPDCVDYYYRFGVSRPSRDFVFPPATARSYKIWTSNQNFNTISA